MDLEIKLRLFFGLLVCLFRGNLSRAELRIYGGSALELFLSG